MVNNNIHGLIIIFFVLLSSFVVPQSAATSIQVQGNLLITREDFVFHLEPNETRFSILFSLKNKGETSIQEFTITLDFEAVNLQAYANGSIIPLHATNEQDASTVTFSLLSPLAPHETLKLLLQGTTFVLQEQLEENTFLFLFLHKTTYPVLVNVKVFLPTSAILSDTSNSNEIVLFPFSPENSTDGTHLIFEWKNLIVDGNQAFFIKYEVSTLRVITEQSTFSLFSFLFGALAGAFFMILLLSLLVVLLIKKKIVYFSRGLQVPFFSKFVSSHSMEPVKPVHLSIPEHKIIKVLRENKGSMLQNDLVDQVQFSKSAVSQYLSKLQKKGIIEKEVMGRTNRIVLIADPVSSANSREDTELS